MLPPPPPRPPRFPAVSLTLVLFIIVIALVFDFFNGFHDAANSIATIVSTRVLSPTQAVIWAAFFNFYRRPSSSAPRSPRPFPTNSSIPTSSMSTSFSAASTSARIAWNIITWLLALPTSSSYALFGGIAGAAVTKSGIGVLILPGKWLGIIVFIFLGPIIGMFMGIFLMVSVSWIFRFSTPQPR